MPSGRYGSDSELPTVERYEVFVDTVVRKKTVWMLCKGEALAKVKGVGGDQYLFWPDKKLAEKCARTEWKGFRADAVSLSDFMDNWLKEMRLHKRNLEIFPTPTEEGLILSPRDVYNDLKNRLARDG